MVKVKKKTQEVLRKLVYGLFVLFLAYLVFELIRKLTSGSLGFEELVIALLIANLGYSFYLKESLNKIDSKISGHLGWHKGKNSKY